MLILHQFVASHFNEKVRWALDYKAVPHERLSYLPGPHRVPIKALSGGPVTTPLLQHDEGTISGSASIIDWLEGRFPTPALYPVDAAQRKAALAWQERFDEVVGPATRTAVFSVFIHEPAHLVATFAAGKPWLKRVGYRALLPLAMPLIKKGNGVYPDNIEKSLMLVQDTLDEVAGVIKPCGYVVGESFTIADLVTASLLAPLAEIDHPDMKRAQPVPAGLTSLVSRWRDHAAIRWVQKMYSQHRGPASPPERADGHG